ncbi:MULTISPECIES: YscO family type III secretion system apparatus protein [unclassified Sinorhizobium]|uniref:type III secretion system stalk subunit SctO n=1 Tax=unclassified Sinorhizobium TaxID=2613772 RepID=UPI0024C3A50A|nr:MULTISPECIES: YscO family type III secretion system apparatus protein [unclassified Sinorhizobium]MDK1378210.1 YscO family type III secretion system apparatus protein [Sinorhizobium sp. 6-70]MDK1482057.1 YscO family type III secretion system apparatus protein [Sinorhizobium sp. 6-117]
MIPKAVHQLLELKQLRRRRAEETLQVRHSALGKAAAAVDTALMELRTWQQERPRREAALYDALIGETVAVSDLEEVKAKIASLHEYEQLLERRLEAVLTEGHQRLQAREEAHKAARDANREAVKFENLVRSLHAGDTAEEEWAAELEL